MHNYACRTAYRGHPRVLDVLAHTGTWTSTTTLFEVMTPWTGAAPTELVDELVDRRILHQLDDRPVPEEQALDRWRGWNPAAGFLHLTTKDVLYAPPGREQGPRVVAEPEPPSLKEYPEARRVALPPFGRDSAIASTLLQRRTWRRFAPGQLSSEELSTLLGLTWAAQGWVELEGAAPCPLKTSPSGGARHSLEAYVVALDVADVPAGTYHYHADEHVLEQLGEGVEPGMLEDMLPEQPWFHEAPVVVFMTSVFARIQWRYPFARAYRVLHIEAGHFGQTFCLVATSLGLAPFTTAALGDSGIERHLGIDGIGESVLYALGAGRRPSGVRWAPDPYRDEAPGIGEPGWKCVGLI